MACQDCTPDSLCTPCEYLELAKSAYNEGKKIPDHLIQWGLNNLETWQSLEILCLIDGSDDMISQVSGSVVY